MPRILLFPQEPGEPRPSSGKSDSGRIRVRDRGRAKYPSNFGRNILRTKNTVPAGPRDFGGGR